MSRKKLDDFVLPHSLEAEMATIGSMMLAQRAAEELVELLDARDFYQPAHAEIFLAVKTLVAKNAPIDLVTVKDLLLEKNKLNEVGGTEYLIQIAESVPTASNASYYAGIVADKANMRRLLEAAEEAKKLVNDPEFNVDEKFDKIETMFQKAMRGKNSKGLMPIKKDLDALADELESMIDGGVQQTGLMTGFTDLDQYLTGLYPGELYIMASRPAMGKTSLASAIAVEVAKKNKPVALFSLEMSQHQNMQRLLAYEAQINIHHLKNKEMPQDIVNKIVDAHSELRNLPLLIDYSSRSTVRSIRSKSRKARAEYGSLALIVIDYLQLMGASQKYDKREAEVSDIVRGLKGLAKDMNIPVLALAQLSRDVDKRKNKRPILSDLRESGAIEQEADVVLFIYRGDYYKSKSKDSQPTLEQSHAQVAETIIAKNRNGPTGTALMGFIPSSTKFCLLDPDSKEAYLDSVRR